MIWLYMTNKWRLCEPRDYPGGICIQAVETPSRFPEQICRVPLLSKAAVQNGDCCFQAVLHVLHVPAGPLAFPGGADSLGQAFAQFLELPADLAPGFVGRLFLGLLGYDCL